VITASEISGIFLISSSSLSFELGNSFSSEEISGIVFSIKNQNGMVECLHRKYGGISREL
jgi:hypothetical protein